MIIANFIFCIKLVQNPAYRYTHVIKPALPAGFLIARQCILIYKES